MFSGSPFSGAGLSGLSGDPVTVLQYLRPISDTFANGWTPSTGSDLYATLDEISADDADYIRSPDNSTMEQFEVRLASGTDPASSVNHDLGLRLRAIGEDCNYDFDFVQGTTVLDSWTENVTVAAGVVARTRTFSSTVANAITDYTDLRLRGVVRKSGTTYYVDTAGSNSANGLTPGTAWQTLSKLDAMSGTFAAGDTICLKRGQTWNEILYAWNVHGAANNPITYTAYGEGARPIISGTGGVDTGIHINTSSYLVFSNMIMEYFDFDGQYCVNACSHIRFANMLARNNGRDGFSCDGDGVVDMDDISYYRCEAYANGRAGFFAAKVTVTGTTGINYYDCKSTYSGQGYGAHNYSAWYANRINWHRCEAAYANINPSTGSPNAFTGEGIGFAYDDASSNGICEYCYSHHNAGVGIAAGHFGNNNKIIYTLIVNNLDYGLVINGDAIGSDNILVYNNTIAGNTGGIAVIAPSAGTIIKNNIISNNGAGWGISFQASGVTSYVVATNIIYNNSAGATVNVTGATGTVTSNPTLNADFTLIAGSPAINGGLNIGSPYDMGLKPGSVWPLAVNTVDQDSFSSWEIGAYVYV